MGRRAGRYTSHALAADNQALAQGRQDSRRRVAERTASLSRRRRSGLVERLARNRCGLSDGQVLRPFALSGVRRVHRLLDRRRVHHSDLLRRMHATGRFRRPARRRRRSRGSGLAPAPHTTPTPAERVPVGVFDLDPRPGCHPTGSARDQRTEPAEALGKGLRHLLNCAGAQRTNCGVDAPFKKVLSWTTSTLKMTLRLIPHS